MSTKSNSVESEYRLVNGRKIKTFGLQVGVTDLHLDAAIKTAFALARSTERERG